MGVSNQISQLSSVIITLIQLKNKIETSFLIRLAEDRFPEKGEEILSTIGQFSVIISINFFSKQHN